MRPGQFAVLAGTALAVLPWLTTEAVAVVRPFSSRFTAASMTVGQATQYVRSGGKGPAVLLLHGFGDTGDMWQPLAEQLVGDHTVISARPARHGAVLPSRGGI